MATSTKITKSTNTRKTTAATKIKAVEKKDEPSYYKCCCCGRKITKFKGNMPASHSEMFRGYEYYLPVCNNCLDALYEHYLNVYGGDIKMTIRRICMAFDMYYSEELVSASSYIKRGQSRMRNYIGKTNLAKYKDKTYDSTLDEERRQVIETSEEFEEKRQSGEISASKVSMERWGVGAFDDKDYSTLEEHYKMLKRNNPNADNNQEIFIKTLCHLNLLMMKALRDDNMDGYIKASEQYSKTFSKAGLKTVQEMDSSVDETLGVTLATISQYTPEEYYKDKELYKDFDGIGEYIKRFITRPLKNLQFGTKERDKDYHVPGDE